MKTVKELLSLSAGHLSKKEIARSRLVAELLLADTLGVERMELYMQHDRPVTDEETSLFREKIQRASTGEPVEYILGKVSFHQATIFLSPDVLIPRQETEILLDKVCNSLDGKERTALDLCCGSGCLSIGLKLANPNLEVTGVDLSAPALKVARENGERNRAAVRWLEGDLTAPVSQEKFDLVLCNPPYISQKEYESLDPSVRDFEPRMALVGGERGDEFYERLNRELPTILNPGAKVFFEIGYNQKESLLTLFEKGPWAEFTVEQDWAGQDRFFCLKMKEFSPILE